VATEYEVNIKLNTKNLTRDLDTVGKKIGNLGKTQSSKAKKALSNSDAVLRKEIAILATENRALRTKGQLLKLEQSNFNVKDQIRKLDLAIDIARRGEVDMAKIMIQKREKAIILSKNQLITEGKITEQKQKQVALSTGIASPVFGKPSQIGSPSNISEVLNNPLSPNSPVQQALKGMEDEAEKNRKQANLNRKKSLSLGKANLKIVENEVKAEQKKAEIIANQNQLSGRDMQRRFDIASGKFAGSGPGVYGPQPRKSFAQKIGIKQGFDFQSALISGGFPLLFGQGPVGAIAGGLGGGIGGMFGQMGGFAGGIVATAAVQSINQAVAAITELGKSLGPFTQNSEAAITALGLQGTAEEARIKLIEKTEGKVAAFNASINLLASQIGDDGVDALTEFGESARLMNSEFATAITRIQAFTAGIANFVLETLGIQKNLNLNAADRAVAIGASQNNVEALAIEAEQRRINNMPGETVITPVPGPYGGTVGIPQKILSEEAQLAQEILDKRKLIFRSVFDTKAEAALLNERFTSVVSTIEEERAETERIIELRKQGLNPEIAKTIAQLEKEAKRSKESLQVEIDKLLQLQSENGVLSDTDQARLTTLEDILDEIDETINGIKAEEEATHDLNKAALETLDAFEQMNTTIQNDIKDGIKGLIKGTSTLGDLLNNVADRFLDLALNQALFGNAGGQTVTGGLFKFLGFANGGRPPVGVPSVVGEKGPELFVPDRSGTIIPNNQLGGSTNVVVNVDASGSNVQGDEERGRELGRLISVAVQSELVEQKRPGGLLA
jgi:hypothetical protein